MQCQRGLGDVACYDSPAIRGPIAQRDLQPVRAYIEGTLFGPRANIGAHDEEGRPIGADLWKGRQTCRGTVLLIERRVTEQDIFR